MSSYTYKQLLDYYLENGFYLLPVYQITRERHCSCSSGKDCKSPGKHPKAKNGFKDATNSRDLIDLWPEGNIGISTGPSNLIVVDIDPRNGGENSLETIKKLINLPRTWTVRTGAGGWHFYYYKTKSSPPLHCRSNVLPGVDIKAEGGYVVAPPSNHISDGTYRVEDLDCPIAEFTDEMVDFFYPRKRNTYSRNSNQKVCEGRPCAGEILKGSRNNELYRLTHPVFTATQSPEATYHIMRVANLSMCKPPLEDDEVSEIVTSALKKHEQKLNSLEVSND